MVLFVFSTHSNSMSRSSLESSASNSKVQWPDGKAFAFTIVDDTENSTVENTKPVYDLLGSLGFRTTKTVWPLKPLNQNKCANGTLEDPQYRQWIIDLQRAGFEIALHGVADESSSRGRVIEGLDRFRDVTGADPRMHINHLGQEENLYWYHDLLVGPPRWLYRAGELLKKRRAVSSGHEPSSSHFWGDLAQKRIEYVRNFTFTEINTIKMDPWMPYHLSTHPYVNFWYSASQATDCRRFLRLLNEKAQDRLVSEGGCCILYTHFGFRFVNRGKLDEVFARLMKRLASLGGFFAPASALLDFLRGRAEWKPSIQPFDLQRLEMRWLLEKWRRGTS
jgi:hypothetical protein